MFGFNQLAEICKTLEYRIRQIEEKWDNLYNEIRYHVLNRDRIRVMVREELQRECFNNQISLPNFLKRLDCIEAKNDERLHNLNESIWIKVSNDKKISSKDLLLELIDKLGMAIKNPNDKQIEYLVKKGDENELQDK